MQLYCKPTVLTYAIISQLTNLCKTLAAAILLTSSTHFGARLGALNCVLLLNRMFRKQCTVRQYRSALSDQPALEIGLGFKLRLRVALF